MIAKFFETIFSHRKLVAFLMVLSLPVTIVYTGFAIENRPPPPVENIRNPVPMVAVLAVQASTHQVHMQGHGEARPRHELTLKAELTGRITTMNPILESGQRLAPGTTLVIMDPTPYEQAVATAKYALASAKLALSLEEQEAKRARDEWQQAGLEKDQASPLLLRKPQLEAAEALVNQARAMLDKAEWDLANTRIRSPFDAMVVERLVAPGQYVQAGDAIATIYSLDRMDVRVSLPLHQWSLLPDTGQLTGKKDVILTSTTGQQWLGEITRIEQHIDSSSRQRSLVVSVYHPMQQPESLLAGTFLKAEFSGIAHEELLAVPASSLSGTGDIWYVNDTNRLSRFAAQIVFQQEGILFVRSPVEIGAGNSGESLAILRSPLSSYVSGQQVIPRFGKEVSMP